MTIFLASLITVAVMLKTVHRLIQVDTVAHGLMIFISLYDVLSLSQLNGCCRVLVPPDLSISSNYRILWINDTAVAYDHNRDLNFQNASKAQFES